MKKIIYTLGIILTAGLLPSCNLTEQPVDTAGKESVFNSADGLKTYSWSFYNAFPTGIDLHYIESDKVDFMATNTMNLYITKNGFSETDAGGWDKDVWAKLRNVNYFIVNCTSERVDKTIRNNYLGLARFFRAYFYYGMVKQFGDVPWIEKPLDINDEQLYAGRDSRELVMEKVYEDLQFAAQNITMTSDATGSLVTKWVAYALASRVSLYEGTFRKYHNLKLATSAETWLQRAVENSSIIMEQAGKKLYTTGGTSAYRTLFTSDNPLTDEILLAVCSNLSLSVTHDANWKWTSATYGSRANLIRSFVNTYLQADGTPYTDREGWETETYYEECQNRDARLSQTIRVPGYKRNGEIALPDYAGYARLGYQPLKFCVDATIGDKTTMNTNALSLFRYAEVLLNYAEAKAELGQLTDSDWAKTVGAIRARAGITGGVTTKPTQIDPYLQSTYFPSVTDPALLEIRRERGCELILEGFRYDDLMRWKCGNLLLMSWKGIYIPDINTPLDMDNNGTPDVIYYTSAEGLEAAKKMIDWEKYKGSCATVSVSTDPGSNDLQVHAAQGGGYYLAWNTQNDNKRVWGPKQYLNPIPALVMVKNTNIKQNPGWENGATNDGQ